MKKLIHTLLLLLLSCFIRVFSFTEFNNGGFTADLIHRDSPHSPSYDTSRTPYDRLYHSILRSQKRQYVFTTAGQDSVQSTVRSDIGEYLMKINVGTPPVEQFVILDTGSDLTWFQCYPCRNCFKQTPAMFDPRKSSTYRLISCKSKQCAAIDPNKPNNCGVRNRCGFHISYADGSFTDGTVSADTFSFPASRASFPRTVFGCSFANNGTFSSGEGSGVVGLSGGRISIINQLKSSINGKFSYCLPSLISNATGKISFGSNVIVSGAGTVTTPIVRSTPFYFLTLEAVSVGNVRIKYGTRSNASAGVQPGNIIIDSGTTLTYLDAEVVSKMEAMVARYIKGERVKDKNGVLNLCYKTRANSRLRAVPRVTMHFRGGGDVVVAKSGVFVEVDAGVWCFAFQGEKDGLRIFGNLAQMNYEVGFDLVKNVVSFTPSDCRNFLM